MCNVASCNICPKNTKEMKRLDDIEAKLSGTLLTITPDVAKSLLAAADVDGRMLQRLFYGETLQTQTFRTFGLLAIIPTKTEQTREAALLSIL